MDGPSIPEKVAQFAVIFAASLEDALADETSRSRLEREVLPGYLVRQRWYRSKAKKLASVAFEAWTRLPPETAGGPVFAVLKAVLENGESGRYALPLAVVPDDEKDAAPESALCRLCCHGGKFWVIDAVSSPEFRAALLRTSLNRIQIPLGTGALIGRPFPTVNSSELNESVESELVKGEQSNTSMTFSSGHFLKLYRRLEKGIHPETEMLHFLEQARYPRIPPFRGALEWESSGFSAIAMALVQGKIEAGGTAWDWALRFPGRLGNWARMLGRRTAGLHLALGSRPDNAAFAPEPVSPEDVAAVRASAERFLNHASEKLADRDPETRDIIRSALSRLRQLELLLTNEGERLGQKIRVHGDLHLGQILTDAADVWFLDFEGEPARGAAEKRLKQSPLRDTAGMLRSFQYAGHAANAPTLPASLGGPFLEAYFEILRGSELLPRKPSVRAALLDLHVLEKTAYELHYELNNRPDWVEIPLRGLKTSTGSAPLFAKEASDLINLKIP